MDTVLKQKILLLLLGGVALSCAYTLRRYYKILKVIGKEWQKIDKDKLNEEIRSLYRSMEQTLQNRT